MVTWFIVEGSSRLEPSLRERLSGLVGLPGGVVARRCEACGERGLGCSQTDNPAHCQGLFVFQMVDAPVAAAPHPTCSALPRRLATLAGDASGEVLGFSAVLSRADNVSSTSSIPNLAVLCQRLRRFRVRNHRAKRPAVLLAGVERPPGGAVSVEESLERSLRSYPSRRRLEALVGDSGAPRITFWTVTWREPPERLRAGDERP
jgi:hypothetical protein